AFSEKLKAAVEREGIKVIGTDPNKTYKVAIDGHNIEISHKPFIKTQTTTDQSSHFKDNEGAYNKVNNVKELTESDGVTRIMSDSHTPLIDKYMKVYNTGKLAQTADMPHEPNTILSIKRNGQGELYQIHGDGKLSPFRPQGKTSSLVPMKDCVL